MHLDSKTLFMLYSLYKWNVARGGGGREQCKWFCDFGQKKGTWCHLEIVYKFLLDLSFIEKISHKNKNVALKLAMETNILTLLLD